MNKVFSYEEVQDLVERAFYEGFDCGFDFYGHTDFGEEGINKNEAYTKSIILDRLDSLAREVAYE